MMQLGVCGMKNNNWGIMTHLILNKNRRTINSDINFSVRIQVQRQVLSLVGMVVTTQVRSMIQIQCQDSTYEL